MHQLQCHFKARADQTDQTLEALQCCLSYGFISQRLNQTASKTQQFYNFDSNCWCCEFCSKKLPIHLLLCHLRGNEHKTDRKMEALQCGLSCIFISQRLNQMASKTQQFYNFDSNCWYCEICSKCCQSIYYCHLKGNNTKLTKQWMHCNAAFLVFLFHRG